MLLAGSSCLSHTDGGHQIFSTIRRSYLRSFSFDGVYLHIWKVNNNDALCEDFEDSLWGAVCEEAQRETRHVFW